MCHDWASKTVYAFQARRCNSASRSYSPPPAGPSGSDALSYKGSLQGSPSQTHSFLGSAAGCPSPLQGDPLLLFPKNSSKTRAGTKRKRAKGPFPETVEKAALPLFLRKQQPAARGIGPPQADKPHTCSLRSVFPDAHAAGENRSQLDSRLRARTLRGFFLYRYFCFCLDLKHSKASRMLCSGAGVSRLTITIATQAHRKAGSSS